jgi:hypothetical protein
MESHGNPSTAICSRYNTWLSLSLCPMALSGCSGAPSLNILGSYFPSWMLCAIAGLIFAILAHRLFASWGIDALLPVRALVYLSLTAGFGFATWLVWLS